MMAKADASTLRPAGAVLFMSHAVTMGMPGYTPVAAMQAPKYARPLRQPDMSPPRPRKMPWPKMLAKKPTENPEDDVLVGHAFWVCVWLDWPARTHKRLVSFGDRI